MPQALRKVQDPKSQFSPTLHRLTENHKNFSVITIEDHLPEDLFHFLKNFENFGHYLKGISAVTILTSTRSRWYAQLKSGQFAEWDSEIVEEVPGLMLSWQSVPYAQITSSGSVWLTRSPSGHGSIVTLSILFESPNGKGSDLLFATNKENSGSLAMTNLHRLKAYLETGEIPTTDGQSSGREQLMHDFLTTRH